MDNIFVYIILALLIVIIYGLREIAYYVKLSPTSFPVNIFGVDKFGSVCLIVELNLVRPIGGPFYYNAMYLSLDRDPIMGPPDIGIRRLDEFQAIFAHEPSSKEIEEVFELIEKDNNE